MSGQLTSLLGHQYALCGKHCLSLHVSRFDWLIVLALMSDNDHLLFLSLGESTLLLSCFDACPCMKTMNVDIEV